MSGNRPRMIIFFALGRRAKAAANPVKPVAELAAALAFAFTRYCKQWDLASGFGAPRPSPVYRRRITKSNPEMCNRQGSCTLIAAWLAACADPAVGILPLDPQAS